MRLEEKEQFLTKKTKQLQDLTDEKSTLTGEIRDLKDMLDVKERKVNVLQKKVGGSVQVLHQVLADPHQTDVSQMQEKKATCLVTQSRKPPG